MTTVEVLKAARAKIAKGWIQNRYGNATGPVCAVAAVVYSSDEETEDSVFDVLRTAIGIDRNTPLTSWNDTPGRTQAEVLAAFDRAIQLAAADTSRDAAGIRHD